MSDVDLNDPAVKAAIENAGAESAAEIQRVLGNRDDILKEKKALAEKLAAFDGVDVGEFKKLKDAHEAAEAEAARAAGNYDELLAKEREKFNGALGDRDTTIEGLNSSLHKALVESAAKSAVAKFGGDTDLLLPHVVNGAKLIEQDGHHVAVVVDERGEPKLAPDAKTATDYMTIEQMVGGWKDEGKYSGAFAGTGASGGGASAGSGAGGSGKVKTISPDDLHKYTKEIQSGEVKVAFD